MISLSHVSFSYNDSLVIDHLHLTVEKGEMVALLGPNGSGKTTLIKLACGVLPPDNGDIYLNSSRLSKLGRKAVAQQVAVVPQQFFTPFSFTLEEVVLLGRTPFLRAFSDERKVDREIVRRAMEMVGVDGLKGRYFNELSGGERQKAVLAMALAQAPRLLLLDEPTAHLDINYQAEILELVQKLNRQQGLTVMAAMHDLNLAALYFDRLVLLKGGRIFADGRPDEVLTEKTIRDSFSASVQIARDPATGAPHVMIKPKTNSG